MITIVSAGDARGGAPDPTGAGGSVRGSDYAVLSRQVKRAGLLARRPGYYGVKAATNLLFLAAGWTAFVLVGPSWWQLAVAAFLAAAFTQTAFLGHDAGHQQISGSKRVNALLGRLHGNLLVGLGYGWWVAKHNRHHAHPNRVGRDPDIGTGAIAFTRENAQARGVPGVWLARRQAWLFFPMLLLEGFHLHLAGVRALFGHGATSRANARGRTRLVEGGLLLVHAAGYLTVLFWVLAPAQAVGFLLLQQGLFGLYLGCSFAPNHKGMPIFGREHKADFLRRQVLTARDIRGGRITDFVLGGLNYQIEHHLFPSMPRPNLRRAQALVRAFCAHHDIAYCETSLPRSYAQVLRHLHAVGGPVRPELEY
ncbi:fatty acid desaturase family protein [Actinomadura violacea]|uniref:Acyl-CoA desaturase n=1 Tax=Actinomadura violacea TaxID=2819934 RepID=A0ABS3RIH3_9ACTN|nr:acyl-CoA desaturase [Actinomadura violacea]MBO2456363.1 acyl-CoA desaturase [Actinomadura violacea]